MNPMKIKIFALLILCTAQLAMGFSYSDSDLLLIFRRDGTSKDVEFNLGTVSNYLGKASGTVIQVTNWNFNTVANNFGSLAGVKFALIATTANSDPVRRSWLTDANDADAPTEISGSKMSALHAKIDSVGQNAQLYTATNSIQSYIIAPTDLSSYTAIASQSGQVDVSTMGGSAPFQVENDLGTINHFFQLKVSNLSVKPAAVQIGSFGISTNGVLTFIAGSAVTPLQRPQIVANGRNGNQQTISFSTIAGGNYRLRYSTVLSPDAANWTVLPAVIAGDGTTKTLTDTSSDAVRFYAVEAFR